MHFFWRNLNKITRRFEAGICLLFVYNRLKNIIFNPNQTLLKLTFHNIRNRNSIVEQYQV